MNVTFGDGSVGEFPDGTPQDVISRVAQSKGGVKGVLSSAPATPKETPKTSTFSDVVHMATKGLTAGFDDELQGAFHAATSGVYNAIKNGDSGEIKKAYLSDRDRIRAEDAVASNNSPVLGTASEIGGSLLLPFGRIAKVGSYAYDAVANAPRLAKIAKLLSSTSVGRAAVAGTAQGALNGAGNSEADNVGGVLEDTLTGAGVGGTVGATVGGLHKLGAAGVRAIMDHSAEAAPNVAYGKIAKLLQAGGKNDPAGVAAQVAAERAGGASTAIMDVTPGTRALAANLSRQTNIPGGNALVEAGENRIAGRNQSLEDKLKSLTGHTTGDDAMAARENLAQQLKTQGSAHGQTIADTGNMTAGEPMKFTPEMGKIITGGGPRWQLALKDAASRMQERDLDPLDHGFVRVNKAVGDGTPAAAEGDLQLTSVPSMHTMDYIKKAVDAKIGEALKAGDRDTASALSERLSSLKDQMAQANPDYAESLGKLRDLYQQKAGTELGENFLARLRTSRPGDGPQYVLKDIEKLTQGDPQKENMVRTGMMDALLKMDNSKADTVKFLRQAVKTPEQRKVMEFLFGGPDKVNDLTKFLDSEGRATVTDNLTSHGRQSGTAIYQMGGDEPVGNVVKNTLRGYAFGGVPGAVSGTIRGLEGLGTSAPAKDRMAQILLSDGSDLVQGVNSAKAAAALRKAKDIKRAEMMARMLQQPYTDASVGN